MSPPPWIHCNLCFHMMAQKERKFYHLSCRHVLCRPCMGKTNRGTQCPVCREPLVRFTELNNQMDRKDKMLYDPGALRALRIPSQSVVFQHRQRESMIRGILRCRNAMPQLKEMDNALRQRIVETQRQYEKFRTYRRNLQDILRQTSPGCGAAMAIRHTVAPAAQPLPPPALPDRDGDRGSCQQRSSPFGATSAMGTPSPFSGAGSVARPMATNQYPPRAHSGARESASVKRFRLVGGEFSNDSGISSSFRTPMSSVSSRAVNSQRRDGYQTPAATRRPHPYNHPQMPSTITRR